MPDDEKPRADPGGDRAEGSDPAEPGDEPAAPEEPQPVEEPAAEPEPPSDEGEATGDGEGEAERPAGDEGGRGELPPGAELDPIAIEPQRELDAEERARLEAEAEERARREAVATEEAREEPVARREPRVELPAEATVQATGKRKSSIARVVVRAGGGAFTVNERGLEDYFPRQSHQVAARQPLVASGYEGTVDVLVRVHGGGISGQAGAVRHGVARALCEIDPELRGELKRGGLLTRDARRKERRKAGLKKARKRPQFSKR